jgi:hypothetical protein
MSARDPLRELYLLRLGFTNLARKWESGAAALDKLIEKRGPESATKAVDEQAASALRDCARMVRDVLDAEES